MALTVYPSTLSKKFNYFLGLAFKTLLILFKTGKSAFSICTDHSASSQIFIVVLLVYLHDH